MKFVIKYLCQPVSIKTFVFCCLHEQLVDLCLLSIQLPKNTHRVLLIKYLTRSEFEVLFCFVYSSALELELHISRLIIIELFKHNALL